ncbi:MAG: hydroxysqualene dehydroxylase HpnE [Gemmatales bacterium]
MPHVIVAGGGLAGLAATVGLAQAGMQVTLLEARSRLGGRAGSFIDGTTGQLTDACQHVSMACCTNFTQFCKTVGIEHLLREQPVLHFMTPDRRVSHWQAQALPAPLHYAGSFLKAHFLTLVEKIRIGTALMRLWLLPPEEDEPFLPWLERNDQTQQCIDRFWSVVLVSALNESIGRVGIRYARQVFVEGFLRTRRGGTVYLPSVPLGELYGEELQRWLKEHDVKLQLNTAVKQVQVKAGQVEALVLRDGTRITADAYVLAVPSQRLPGLFADTSVLPELANIERLETSPITSVHFWHDRPITELPHVVLLDSASQWLFNRGQVETNPKRKRGALAMADSSLAHASGWYTQVVISAARSLAGLGNEAIKDKVEEELRQFFPALKDAELLHYRVVTEKQATFSVVPGVDDLRPGQATSLTNLFLAGDYTRSGWPATMEGAVRSGYLAAKALSARFPLPPNALPVQR